MHRLLAILFLLSSAFAARAQDVTWSLTTADLATDSVTIKSFGPDGLAVTPALGGDARKVPLDQFVELSRPGPATPPPRTGKFDLLLVGGERVNGEPVGMKGESLLWSNPVAGEVPVPLRVCAALIKAGERGSLDRKKDDEVVLGNGDVVRGAVLDLSAKEVAIRTDAGDSTVPFASVAAVHFAAIGGAGGNKPSFRVRLDEGSSIAASQVKLADGKLEVTLGTGAAAQTKSLDPARVTLVEQVNGPVSFLSGLPARENVYTPYLGSDARFVARFNSDFDGNPIRFRDRTYARSVATHAYSRVVWDLPAGYVSFRTRYAMDPKASQGAGGDVTVRIKLDDKVVHEQANVRPGALSPPVAIDIGQARTLTLEVDYGRLLDSNDRLNWIEPALLKVKPVEPATEKTK